MITDTKILQCTLVGRAALSGRVLAILMVLCLTAIFRPAQVQAQAPTVPVSLANSPTQPWWDDYPLITQTEKMATCFNYPSSTVGYPWSVADPSWGIYGLRITRYKYDKGTPEDWMPQVKILHDKGIKCMSYYETFGTNTNFMVELGQRGTEDYTPIKTHFWSWWLYKNGPIRWVGIPNYYECDDFTGIWNRHHPRYGGPAMTYPDGKIAVGYIDNETTNPLKSRVLDASSSKDILGKLRPYYTTYVDAMKDAERVTPGCVPKNPTTKGLWKIGNSYTGHIGLGKDIACPFWANLQYASILYAADNGIDAIWSDNFSPFDNFGYPPVKIAFGDWSVTRFRDYLKKNFTPGQRQGIGVADVGTFNVRAALRARAKAFGGDDTNLDDPVWNDPRWLENPLWHAYIIYKRQVGSEGLNNYYCATKAAAAAAKPGNPDFLLAGNDIPLLSLGYPRGELDMVSSEVSPAWHMGTSSRGVMLPPLGRFAPIYKLGREHAKSRLVSIWFYLDNYNYLWGKPEVANVLEYEMLANHTLPMLHPDIPKVAGNPKSNAAFFKFVASCKATYGQRLPVEDIGIYYSSSSVLAYMTPMGFFDLDKQEHQFGHYGWGTVLGELHYQYRPIPEWKLNAASLKPLRIFIIPNAEVLDQAEVTNVIEPWVKAGGLLIVTGDSGYRRGEAGNFEPKASGLSLASLTGVANMKDAKPQELRAVGDGKVLFIRDNIGMAYWNADKERATMLPQFQVAIDDIMKDREPMVLNPVSVPGTVGLVVYEDAKAGRLFVDANNYNYSFTDPLKDKANKPKERGKAIKEMVKPTVPITFTVKLPDWLKNVNAKDLKVKVMSPDGRFKAPRAKLKKNAPDRLEVTLSSFRLYACVVIEAKSKLTASAK